MIYKCEKCGKEMSLDKGALYCPFCAGEVKPINIMERVAGLYKEGLNTKEISAQLGINDITVDQTIAKAMARGFIPAEGIIQTEYEDDVKAIINSSDWDRKLKTIKENVPEQCSYTTIQYYAEQEREKSRKETAEKVDRIRDMAKKGMPVEEISDKLKASKYLVERIIVEECGKDDAIADSYINAGYDDEIIGLAKDPDWDGTITSIKQALPDDVSYISIKASLAKHGI